MKRLYIWGMVLWAIGWQAFTSNAEARATEDPALSRFGVALRLERMSFSKGTIPGNDRDFPLGRDPIPFEIDPLLCVGPEILLKPSPWVTIGAAVMYGSTQYSRGSDFRVVPLECRMQFHPFDNQSVNPFVEVGGGYVFISPNTGKVYFRVETSTGGVPLALESGPILHVGGGAEFPFSHRVNCKLYIAYYLTAPEVNGEVYDEIGALPREFGFAIEPFAIGISVGVTL